MSMESILYAERAHAIRPVGNGGYVAVFEQMTDSFRARYQKALVEKYTLHYAYDFDGEEALAKNHFEAYTSETETVYFSYHLQNGRAYAVYMPKIEGWALPPATAPAFARLGDAYPTIMTDVGTEHCHPTQSANCQIVRVADGSFVIIDSAYGDGAETILYDMLKKQAPDPEHIVISAWIFTHAHWDHVGGFCYFVDRFAGKGDVELRQVVCNFPDDSLLNDCDKNLQQRTLDAAKRFNENVTFIKPHTGEILYYADVKFRFLYTQEEELAVNEFHGYYNATSCVFRMETEDGVSYLCGGDHMVCGQVGKYLGGEGALYRWYGSFIRSDIVAAFHHGLGGGADTLIYHFVQPGLVLWPTSWNRIYNDDYGKPYGVSLDHYPTNMYFTDPAQAKAHQVEYIVSGDAIHVFDFKDGAYAVTKYDSVEDYLNA